MQNSEKQSKAVAIKYDDAVDSAPKVVAKGSGYTAKKIYELAKFNGIPIREDDDLVEVLSKVELNSDIPPELYAAVAEVLSLVYRANSEVMNANK